MENKGLPTTPASPQTPDEFERELAKKDALICELRREVAQLHEQIKVRKVIEQAKCLLIEAGTTENEAFGRMRKVSMDTRKPLIEVAEAIILSHKASQQGEAAGHQAERTQPQQSALGTRIV